MDTIKYITIFIIFVLPLYMTGQIISLIQHGCPEFKPIVGVHLGYYNTTKITADSLLLYNGIIDTNYINKIKVQIDNHNGKYINPYILSKKQERLYIKRLE